MKNTLLFIVVIALAGTSGFVVQQLFSTNSIETKSTKSSVINKPAQAFAMKDLDGNIRELKDWQGKVILLNFWATWCPPCLKEIPDFIDLQNKYKNTDFQIIGIAMDNIDAVRAFAKSHGMNYPIIPAETDAIELGRLYGNTIGALPYSVFINKKGDVTHTITGELDKLTAEKILFSLNIRPTM